MKAAAIFAFLIAVFAGLASAMHTGVTGAFDEAVVRAARDAADPTRLVGPPWVTEVARDATALGGGAFATFVVVVVAGFLLIVRKRNALLAILVAVGGGAVLSNLLKAVFDRPRPSVVPHLSIVQSSSFPSGHSILAAVVYCTLAAMLTSLVESRVVKLYIAAVAAFLVVAVGASRVLLGVHYPTDVVAGWAAGAAWALACGLVMKALQRRDVVEDAGETTEDNVRGRSGPALSS